ncbi:sterile alpha motif domain-containing protein 12-like isoform X8 [Ascaphus truei]|uniref:sterile alpha motif domain-containing protein 12-like isoform X8 n=1 Tax=Ascaphus truei TaxID=8439 RepID=UPI003F59F21A
MPRRAYNLNWFMRSRDIEGLVHSSWTRRGISGETRRRRQSFQDEDIWEKPVCDWTVQDVCYWFQSGPLQEVAGLVQAAYTHDISGRALLRLTDDLLQRMGIHQEGPRRMIVLEVLQLRLQQELQQLSHITEVTVNHYSTLTSL